MHMANELLSVPVAAGTLAVAAAGLGLICRKLRELISSEKLALMGVLGAFVFAAQMVNFQLPAMPGTSGHVIGAVLLAIMLGPHAAALVISSVVIIQCLIFQDGGLLALGCNIINMAIVPSYLGYFIYRSVAAKATSGIRVYLAALPACVLAIEAGAVLVPVQAALSKVLVVPFTTFLATMLGVHFLVGICEGLITVAVLGYVRQMRPDLVVNRFPGEIRLSRKAVLATFLVLTVAVGAVLSLFASSFPDGLEWSYAERPEKPDFQPYVANEDDTISAVDDFQSKYSLLPDYSARSSKIGRAAAEGVEPAAGWTSFAAVAGSALTMGFVWLTAQLLRKKRVAQNLT